MSTLLQKQRDLCLLCTSLVKCSVFSYLHSDPAPSCPLWNSEVHTLSSSDNINKWYHHMCGRQRLDHTGSSWILLYPTILPDPTRSYLVLLVPTKSYWNLLDPTRSYLVLLVPTESYCNLLDPTGSYWILLNPTGSYWSLLDTTESYCILLDPTGFYLILLDHTDAY